MTTPATRTPVRIARGAYADLNASIADILDGEICWATDEDKIYVKDGGSLVATMLTSADVGVTVQAYDADTAKTDVAQTFSAPQRGSVTALSDAASITPDFSTGNNFSVTLGGDRTLENPTNAVAGQSGVIVITQDATGSRTLAYGTNWKFGGGTDPTLTTAANAVDVLSYYCASPTVIIGTLLGDVK